MSDRKEYQLTIGIDPGVEPAVAMILSGGDTIHLDTCVISLKAEGDPAPDQFYTAMYETVRDLILNFMLNVFDGDKPDGPVRIVLAIEDVRMQYRAGQSVSSAMKLQAAFHTCVAAASLLRMFHCDVASNTGPFDLVFSRPQEWQAFYALRMRGPQPTKIANREMAVRVLKDIEDEFPERITEGPQVSYAEAFDDHNLADAFLIAMHALRSGEGWFFYRPLAKGAH